MDQPWKKSGKNRKSKRIKPQESSDSTTSGTKFPHRFPLQGLNTTAWSPSDTSQASYSAMSFPTVMPAYPLPVFPATGTVPPAPETSLSGFNQLPDSGNTCPMQPSQFSAPLMTPVVALVLPNYVYPEMNSSLPQTLYHSQANFPTPSPFSSQTVFPAQTPFSTPSPFPQQAFFPTQPFHYNAPAESEKVPATETRNEPSRSCTPQSVGAQDQASPPLFQSRCSSPLNLLQLEETTKTVESGAPAGFHGALNEEGAIGSKIVTTDNCSGKGSLPVSMLMGLWWVLFFFFPSLCTLNISEIVNIYRCLKMILFPPLFPCLWYIVLKTLWSLFFNDSNHSIIPRDGLTIVVCKLEFQQIELKVRSNH